MSEADFFFTLGVILGVPLGMVIGITLVLMLIRRKKPLKNDGDFPWGPI